MRRTLTKRPNGRGSQAKTRRYDDGLCCSGRRIPGMPERTFETLWSTASEALERIPTRACVETAAVVLATLALSELFSFALSTASIALLFMSAVVVAGIRHGLWMALLGSALSVLAMTLFPWQTRFSAER